MLEDVLAAATTAADGAEDTAAAALKNRDLYDQDQLQPARIAAQQAEKLAHGLSRESARLKEWLDSSDYLAKQQIVINAAKAEMERAQNTWDTALAAHEVRRKEIVGRWTELFLLRLQQINPNVETAYIDAADFTTRVKEHNDPDKGFADCFVMGSPKVVINVALLLSLRDLGRTDPGVRVPPLLIIDSPLADLGVVDRATGDRLIDALIDIAPTRPPTATPAVLGFVVMRLVANEWLARTGEVPWTLRPGPTAQQQGIVLPAARKPTAAVSPLF